MSVIIKPVITEKMTGQSEKFSRYGFMVNRDANKLQIKEAVESLYGVKVADVNTMTVAGKTRNRYTKTGVINGTKGAWKKAMVTLAEGEVIDFYSNI